ncbi:vasculin-like [Aplochiton taeniatus]
MAQHDFTPAWLNFPSGPSSTKSFDRPFERAAERLDNQSHVSLRRHNSSDGSESLNGRSGGGSRGERNGWKVRNGSEGSSSRSTFQHGSLPTPPRSKVKGQVGGTSNRRKQFGAEDFPSLNPDANREVNQNRAVAAGVWEHPPNPQSRGSKMMVIKRLPKEEPLSAPPHTAPPRSAPGPSLHRIAMPKSLSLPAKARRSSSLSPVEPSGQPRLMMRLTRMRSDRKSDFLKALKQDMEGDEELPHHGKDEDGFHLQDNGNHGDENRNGYGAAGNGAHHSQRNGNGSQQQQQQLLRSSTFPQQEALLSSSLEAEHRLLKEMGWQEESENDETCAPLTEDEMREFQAISEQLQRNGLRRSCLLRLGSSGDPGTLGRTNNHKMAAREPAATAATGATAPGEEEAETETSSSDTSDDEL